MRLQLIDLEFESEGYQWYHFIVNSDYRNHHSVKGWKSNGERRDINVPVFSCWLRDKEFKELHEQRWSFLPPYSNVEQFLYDLLDAAASCNFEDELTLHLSHMLADNTKQDKEEDGD